MSSKLTVEYRVYDFLRFRNANIVYDYVEFDIINYKRERVLSFSAFMDELLSCDERNDACERYCGCSSCKDLQEQEISMVVGYSDMYESWEVDSTTVVSPRIFKFTGKKDVSYQHRPSGYNKLSNFLSKDELQSVFEAINEIMRRHREFLSSNPYLAIPASTTLDSLYNKVMEKRLGINLDLNVSRYVAKDDMRGSIYVVQ